MNTDISQRLYRYKRRFYVNLILKGSIYILTVLFSVFLFFNFIEYIFHSSSPTRALLFFGYLAISAFVLYKWLLVHLIKLLFRNQQISDEDAARIIGDTIPEIKDKLLNLVQLNNLDAQNRLLIASVKQRSQQMNAVHFEESIDLKENLKYIKFLIIPFVLVAAIWIISPSVITEPAKRIVHFKKEYLLVAPFKFEIQNKDLLAFRNEDFVLEVNLSGEEIPDNAYLVTSNRKIKLQKRDDRRFSHTFEKVQESVVFHFEAAGFSFENHTIKVVNRPNIIDFSVSLQYPGYINKKPENLDNIGSFEVPAGTKATWHINTTDTREMQFLFDGDNEAISTQNIDNQLFELEKPLLKTTKYSIILKNEYSNNKEAIQYTINVIPDEYPKISLDQLRDTVLYQYLIFGGNISDDYGITELNLFYRKLKNGVQNETPFIKHAIKFDPSKESQSFYYHWNLDDFELTNGEEIEYFLQIKDNDAINGKKATNTARFVFMVPTDEELREELKISTEKSENQLDNTVDKAKEFNKELKQLNDKLKGKKELSWQDQKQIEDIIKQKEALDKAIKELQEQYKSDAEKRERFDKGLSPELKEKIEQLQKLMDELLDPETKKLFEELEKLLEEQKSLNDIKDVLDKLQFKEENFEKELERTLELFKKMKFEMKLNENVQRAKELQDEQEKTANESLQKSSDVEKLQEKQEKLNKEFEGLKNELKNMQQLNQDLAHPKPLPDVSEELKSIEESQKQASENLQKNNKKKAGKAQQGASQQLKKLSDKLQSMQSMMMQSSINLNFNQLRDIMDNLIKLSFEQESIMKEFRKVHQSDPRFLQLSEKQLKIKDDAKVLQDSLISLSKEDFRIQSFVTRKVDEMNRYLDESVEAIRERNKGESLGKQQYAMKTMNDLALMLDDVMTQMMNAMGMGGGQPQNARVPSLSELQQQLSEKIQQLKKSGKTGRQLSEELAKMAAEQERIRQMMGEMMEEMEKNSNGKSGNSLDDIEEKMELSELDLVNKRLTQQLIERQKEIVTRLLEAENAEKERELDDEREGERAKKYEQQIPDAFKEYIKAKEKEIELLKTVPPKLNPYYKKEVNEYFKRLGS